MIRRRLWILGLALVAAATALHAPALAANGVSVAVNAKVRGHPVDPLIFGVNDASFLAGFGPPQPTWRTSYPIVRWGGNYATRYNYKLDAFNAGADYYFLNITYPRERLTENTPPPRVPTSDRLIGQTLSAGRDELFTIPMIGWTVKDRRFAWSYSISKYGAQPTDECTGSLFRFHDPQVVEYCQPDAGDGIDLAKFDPFDLVFNPMGPLSGHLPFGYDGFRHDNDPRDTSVPVGTGFARDWMRHLVKRFGDSAHGGVRYMTLDNEPALWYSTHADVRHTRLGYDELWAKTAKYAAAIKSVDPGIKIFGPAEWGWCGYFSSAVDSADDCTNGPDRAAHKGTPLLKWYLQQVCAHPLSSGRRLVDYLDVHYYPDSNDIASTDDSDPDRSARRLRNLKSLYDPKYVDESYLATPIMLIPRMRAWINEACPGTKLAITEYNFGDGNEAGAIAQAEALAIFAREGVDAATRFWTPPVRSRLEDAFRLYLDYDGRHSAVHGDSVRAKSSNVDAVGAYAISARGGPLYVLLFNKDTAETPVSVTGLGSATRARLYRFDAGHALGSSGAASVTGGRLSLRLPARSATLAVLTPR